MIHKLFLLGIFPVLLLLVRNIFHLNWIYFPFLVSLALFLAIVIDKNFSFSLRDRFKKLNPRFYLLILLSMASIYFIVFFTLSCLEHRAYSTGMLDLGNMDQAIYNTDSHHLLELTMITPPYANVSRFSFHVEFIYLIIALLYKILPEPNLLFFLQTLSFSVSGIILFFLAKRISGKETTALAIAAIFYLFPSNQFNNLFVIHADSFCIPFLLLFYLKYLDKKWLQMFIFLFLALSCKEYVSLAIIGFGIGIIFKNRDIKMGSLLTAVGIGYFIFAMYIIIPHFNHGQESFLISKVMGNIGGDQGLGSTLNHIFSHPVQFLQTLINQANLQNTFYLFFPIFFLCFLSPWLLLGSSLIILKDLIYGLDIYNHHLSPAIPFIFIALIYGINKTHLKSIFFLNTRFKVTLCVVAAFISSYAFGPSPLGHRFWRETYLYTKTNTASQIDSLITKIPGNASVSTSGFIAPHLTHRKTVYIFPRPEKFDHVDFILIDTAYPRPFWGTVDTVTYSTASLLKDNFKLLEQRGSLMLLKRQKD